MHLFLSRQCVSAHSAGILVKQIHFLPGPFQFFKFKTAEILRNRWLQDVFRKTAALKFSKIRTLRRIISRLSLSFLRNHLLIKLYTSSHVLGDTQDLFLIFYCINTFFLISGKGENKDRSVCYLITELGRIKLEANLLQISPCKLI